MSSLMARTRELAFLPCFFAISFTAPVVLVEGCASTPTPGEFKHQFVVISTRKPDAESKVTADELEPLRTGHETWARIDGSEPFFVETAASGAEFTRSDPLGSRQLGTSAGGARMLISQTDASDGSMTRFIPPLLIAPAIFTAQEECTATAVVETMRGTARDAEGGRAQRSATLAAIDRIQTPLGECTALRIDAVFTLKVPYASMRRETSTWVKPGRGPIAIRSEEKILIMGIVPRNRSETRVLLLDGAKQ